MDEALSCSPGAAFRRFWSLTFQLITEIRTDNKVNRKKKKKKVYFPYSQKIKLKWDTSDNIQPAPQLSKKKQVTSNSIASLDIRLKQF